MTGMETAFMALSAVGTVVNTLGTIAQGNQAKAQGIAAQNAANFRAAQLEQQAGQERAAAQRNAIEERRQARLAMSRGLAVAAASGGGALDPTVVNLLGDVQAEGDYRALMRLYQGEERARGAELGATAARYEGDSAYAAGVAAQRNSRFAAVGNLVTGLGKVGYMGYKAGLFTPSNSPAPIAAKTIAGSGGGYAPLYQQYGQNYYSDPYIWN